MTKPTSTSTEHVVRALEKSAAELDADTTRALRLARETALEKVHDRRRAGAWPLWMGSAMAAVLLVVVGLQLRDGSRPAGGTGPESMMADLEVLTQEDDLELIEDLEFLDWLSRVDEENT